jgi:hypothetical protein
MSLHNHERDFTPLALSQFFESTREPLQLGGSGCERCAQLELLEAGFTASRRWLVCVQRQLRSQRGQRNGS